LTGTENWQYWIGVGHQKNAPEGMKVREIKEVGVKPLPDAQLAGLASDFPKLHPSTGRKCVGFTRWQNQSAMLLNQGPFLKERANFTEPGGFGYVSPGARQWAPEQTAMCP
jgi:hypothetical protein